MSMIKTLNALLAATLLVGATAAHAAPYDVNGTLTGFSTDPGIITATFNPTAPTFNGNWNVEINSLTGNANFNPYSVNWSVLGSAAGTTAYTTDTYQLNPASYDISYNAGTRTLTSTGTLVSTGATYTCSTGSLICGSELPQFQLNLTLVFSDATLSAFSGTAVATGGSAEGLYTYNWSFNGSAPEVPVPAAVWLFGSGLLGLAGVARSRKEV